VVTYLVTKGKANGTKEPSAVYIRAVKATGEWKETRYGFDGHTTIRSATADAQYSMIPGDSSLQYESKYSLEKETYFHSGSFLESHPQFARRETILGLTTYVLHGGNADQYMETSYAPECGATPLRVLLHNSGDETTIEAIRVEFREVSEREASLPDLPTHFDQAEQKVDILRTNGLSDQADGLSRGIKEAKTAAKDK